LDNGGERTTRSRRRRCPRRVHLVDFNTRRTRSDFSEGSLFPELAQLGTFLVCSSASSSQGDRAGAWRG
jgi:hypothetical protein